MSHVGIDTECRLVGLEIGESTSENTQKSLESDALNNKRSYGPRPTTYSRRASGSNEVMLASASLPPHTDLAHICIDIYIYIEIYIRVTSVF